MYHIKYSTQFKRSLKLCKKRGYDLTLLHKAITLLSQQGELPKEYRPHMLSGKYSGLWECHIKPDWLLVWEQNDSDLILLLLNTGTHSDLF